MKKTYSFMRNTAIVFTAVCFFFSIKGTAQVSPGSGSMGTNIYVSVQQAANLPSYSGSYSKTTDKFENGTMTITSSGPIVYNINPPALSIGTLQSKTWTGTISGDPTQIPPAGTSKAAKLIGNYNINFSRPQGASSSGTVTSTYNCGNCPVHGSAGGVHELVNQVGQDSIGFNVVSIKATVAGKILVCEGDSVEYTATTYPASGGTVTWSTGQTGRTVKILIPNTMTVRATFSIGGASYTDSLRVVATAVSPWTFGVGIPPIAGWASIQDKLKTVNDAAKKALSFLPGQVDGPNLSFSYKVRDCCKDGVVTVRGESQTTIDVAIGYYAKDIGVPYLSGQLPAKTVTVCGYSFCVIVNLGMFIDAGAELKGSFGARKNICKPEDCFTGAIGLNFPIALSAKANAKVAYTTWFGNPDTLGISITAASVSTNFFGQVTYNAKTCTDGLGAAVGMGPVVFTAGIKILGVGVSYSKTLWDGGLVYQVP